MSRHHVGIVGTRRGQRTCREAFELDHYRSSGQAGRLECDHVRPLWQYPEQDPFDPDGCQALCIRLTRASNATGQRHRALIREQGPSHNPQFSSRPALLPPQYHSANRIRFDVAGRFGSGCVQI